MQIQIMDFDELLKKKSSKKKLNKPNTEKTNGNLTIIS